jgi:hypothetical protein
VGWGLEGAWIRVARLGLRWGGTGREQGRKVLRWTELSGEEGESVAGERTCGRWFCGSGDKA